MEDLTKEIVDSYKKGLLLEYIHNKTIGNWDQREILIEELIKLHNHGEINLVCTFQTLKNQPNPSPYFFSTRDIFEKALPKLNAFVEEVMVCVINLVSAAGKDMAAGSILHPFVDYCVADPTRPNEALSLFKNNPDRYMSLLPQILLAGSRLDIESYVNEALRLAGDENIELRRIAIFSLGLIAYPEENKKLNELALSCLDASLINETDDQLLGRAIRSEFNLYKSYKFPIKHLTETIDIGLSKGGDYCLHTCADIFSMENNKVPDLLLDCILSHLVCVKPENKGTLERIDYGIVKLLERGNKEKAINFLENILLANPEKLSLSLFDSVIYELFKNQENILNLILTRWFYKGNKILCEGVSAITNLANENDILLGIEPSELNTSDPISLIFIARKAIGYLFTTPITTASILISIISNSSNNEINQEIINLLYDPLILNYPGKVIKITQQFFCKMHHRSFHQFRLVS